MQLGLFTLIVFGVQAFRATGGYTSHRGTFYTTIHKHRNGGYFIALSVFAVHAAAVVEGRTGYRALEEQAALLALLAAAVVFLLRGAKRKGTQSIPSYDMDGNEHLTLAASAAKPAAEGAAAGSDTEGDAPAAPAAAAAAKEPAAKEPAGVKRRNTKRA